MTVVLGAKVCTLLWWVLLGNSVAEWLAKGGFACSREMSEWLTILRVGFNSVVQVLWLN